jgi:hypothetical protein
MYMCVCKCKYTIKLYIQRLCEVESANTQKTLKANHLSTGAASLRRGQLNKPKQEIRPRRRGQAGAAQEARPQWLGLRARQISTRRRRTRRAQPCAKRTTPPQTSKRSALRGEEKGNDLDADLEEARTAGRGPTSSLQTLTSQGAKGDLWNNLFTGLALNIVATEVVA